MKIKIFATGGTIDKIYFDQKSAYEVGEPQAAAILARSNINLAYDVESILRKDSLDFTDDDRALIRSKVASCEERQVIITHGTDGMIGTAKALGEIKDKTIVFTGAMQPALFLDSDAVFNVGCAVSAVQTLVPGIYIAMNGRIFDPQTSVKNVALNRFEERG